MTKTFCLQSLGCRVNHTEADGFRRMLLEAGYLERPTNQPCDLAIVHTCTVTGAAASKSRQAIHRLQKVSPEAIMVVTGCYAQMSDELLAADPDIDIIIGTHDRHRLLELIQAFDKEGRQLDLVDNAFSFPLYEELPGANFDKTRAFIKIQEGCQQFCSYCIIPYARGPIRSRPLDSVLAQARAYQEAGFRELVLTGICTGAYGRDLEGVGLADLLSRLDELSFDRIRLGSLDPQDFDHRFFSVLQGGSSFMNHFHLALQSGCDRTLGRMRRGYGTDHYRQVRSRLDEIFPKLAVTTDLMVGFPGETDQDHAQSMAFVREMAFADIHVFAYSPRQGTRAASFPDQIQAGLKEARLQEMLSLKKSLQADFRKSQVGRTLPVLVEKVRREPEGLSLSGYSDHYAWVRSLPLEDAGLLPEALKNSIINVEIKSYDQAGLVGAWLRD